MQHQDEYEIKSSLILQPGPAALTDGLDELHRIVERWASGGRSGMKAAIPHVMKSADKKELEPVTPSSTVTLNPPSRRGRAIYRRRPSLTSKRTSPPI